MRVLLSSIQFLTKASFMTVTIPPVSESFAVRVARKVGEFNVATINVPPAEHRLKNVVGLSLGIYLGRELMNLATARNWDGSVKEKESVPAVLQPLYNVMPYNKYSDDSRDRWLKVIDNTVPAALGGLGAYYGSYDFFSTRTYKDLKPIITKIKKGEALTLAEANIAASMKQGEFWRTASAFSTFFGSSSFLNYSPVFSFGHTLGSSFNKGLGRTMGGKLPEPLAIFISGFTEAIEPAVKVLTDDLFPKINHHVFTEYAQNNSVNLDALVPYMEKTTREALSRHMTHKFRTEEGQQNLHDMVAKIKGLYENLITRMDTLHAEGKLDAEAMAACKKWTQSLAETITKEGGLEHILQTTGTDQYTKVQPFKGSVELIADFFSSKSYVEEMEKTFQRGFKNIAAKGGSKLEALEKGLLTIVGRAV